MLRRIANFLLLWLNRLVRNSDQSAIFVSGKKLTLTEHAIARMQQREIPREWVADVLVNWVGRKFNHTHQSLDYYGFVPGRNSLLMVAVSEDERQIITVHFDTPATRRYRRKTTDFDEVRYGAASEL